ncbi:hypothetical protein TNIN_7241 [Trichonephila inaurata madagascariensis]|uniref:Uncharacterized protein n=1 Tax=Trichonephila inaurata madagascariensis TaxID=2747483 RepID=A0A8X6I407_9ARAC|nr:hypothetical protein TNIN_7241 [Trichonephila inaurata madagascariensis]
MECAPCSGEAFITGGSHQICGWGLSKRRLNVPTAQGNKPISGRQKRKVWKGMKPSTRPNHENPIAGWQMRPLCAPHQDRGRVQGETLLSGKTIRWKFVQRST